MRNRSATRKSVLWISVAVLCGVTLHLLDRAWLLRVLPQDAKSASPVAVSAPLLKPLVLSRDAPKVDTASPPPSVTVASASERPTAPDLRSPARVVKASQAPLPDDYRASLDWKNPYGPPGPLKR
jgi:hypothetical protein